MLARARNFVSPLVPIVPLVHNLEQDGTVEFRFVHGTHEVPPPRGHTEFFGPPPHYSFCTDFSVEEAVLAFSHGACIAATLLEDDMR